MKVRIERITWRLHILTIVMFIILMYGCSGTGYSQTILLDLSIENGVMTPNDILVTHQDKIIINVTSDKRGSIHIHGYDLEQYFEKGKQAKLEFEAYATGKFNIAFHGSGEHDDHSGAHSDHRGSHEEFIIGSLTVNPD